MTPMRCWCEDECLCGAQAANELFTEAEYREALETAREAESEILWDRAVTS